MDAFADMVADGRILNVTFIGRGSYLRPRSMVGNTASSLNVVNARARSAFTGDQGPVLFVEVFC